MITEPTKLGVPDIPGSYYDQLMEARWHQDRDEWEEAGAIYQRLVDRLSGLPERRRLAGSDLNAYLVAAAGGLATSQANLGDFEAVQRMCDHLLVWDAEKADFWHQYVFILRIAVGQVDDGLAGLRQLAEAEPDNFSSWMGLADEAIAARRFELAEQAIERAAVLAPDAQDEDAVTLVHFAAGYDFYRLQRRWKEAGAEWDNALLLDEAVAESQEGVLRMFLEAELWDDARRYIGGALDAPFADYYEGYLAYRRGDKVRARALWRKVVEAVPQEDETDVPGPQAMAWCYLGKPLEALKLLLDEVSSSGSVNARAAVILALAWAMDGNLKAAKTDLDIATKILCETPDDKLSRFDWYDFDQLVEDETIKAALCPYFEADPPDA